MMDLLFNGIKFLIEIFYQISGDYGIAIIILTLLIRLCMFPINRKQKESIRRQQDLSIQIATIKEKYKKNPSKANKEIEALKVAKAKKATITSRGGSKASRETVQASAPLNEDWIWANASAYCACVKCCGKTNGITASGTKATAGRTIAAPKNYPFGTKIEIAGMGTYVVEDRGGAITGNKIDIYFGSSMKENNHSHKTN